LQGRRELASVVRERDLREYVERCQKSAKANGVRSTAAGSRSIASPSTRKRKKHFSAATVRAWLAGAGRWAASAARKWRSSAGRTSAHEPIPSPEKGETGADVARVGRAGERREALLDPAMVDEVVELAYQGVLLRARRGPLSAKI